MITYQLRRVLERTPLFRGGVTKDTDPGFPYCLYIIRSDEVLYVGQSAQPVLRIKEHVQSQGELGLYIAEHRPASLDWSVDFLTLADMRYRVSWDSPNRSIVVNRAETELILQYNPRFNRRRLLPPGPGAWIRD